MKNMEKLKPRKITNNLMSKLLKGNDLIVLLGARQVGKTSTMHLLMNRLLQREKIKRNRVFYFDLEDMNILEVVNKGVEEFIAFLEANGADLKKRCFVFLDEIQYMENPSNFLKILVDHHKKISLVVSGSSSFSIRNKFKDSLAGRKRIFAIYPLDFGEFLEFKGRGDLADFLNTGDWEKARFFESHYIRYYEEYVIFGGLPRVSLLPTKEEKVEYLKDVVNSYIKKDIKDLFRIDNPYAFNRVIKLLAVFLMLLTSKAPLEEIYYWRTKAGAEMDFVLKGEGESLRGYDMYQEFLSG